MKAIIFVAVALAIGVYCADVLYAGTYNIGTTVGSSCCVPGTPLSVSQASAGKAVTATWTWANTDACGTRKNEATSATGTPTATDSGSVTLAIASGKTSAGSTVILTAPAGSTLGSLTLLESACAVGLVKSAYLLGLGSMVLVSLSYLMF